MLEELARALRHYDLGELQAARRTERGFVNQNWIITTDRGRYFLKRRHPSLRRPELVRAQHALVTWLREAAFPAPAILPTTGGASFLHLDDELYEVHAYIHGQPYDPDRPRHLEGAALTLGRYHNCIRDFTHPALRRPGDLYHPTLARGTLVELRAAWRLDRRPNLTGLLRSLGTHLTELGERFARHGALPYLIIHGDYYAGNLLFDGDRVVGVVDYDKARRQPRVVELAEALIYFASPRPGHLRHLVYPGFLEWAPLRRFLRSYGRAVRPGAEELAALPDYVRCIWIQMSLLRLLERGKRPPRVREALEEVLALADWAQENAQTMVERARLFTER